MLARTTGASRARAKGSAAACGVALLISGCGISDPPTAALATPEETFAENAKAAVCGLLPRRQELERRLAAALESRPQAKTHQARMRAKLRRIGRLLPAFESYHGDLAQSMRGVEAPIGVVSSVWEGLVEIVEGLEREAQRADEKVRAGQLFAAIDFVDTLFYSSKLSAVLSREAGPVKNCPGQDAG